MKVAEHLPGTFATGTLGISLMKGVKWLQQASEVVSAPCCSKRCTLSDAEEVLACSQVLISLISFHNFFLRKRHCCICLLLFFKSCNDN